jgi:hypothetical protein
MPRPKKDPGMMIYVSAPWCMWVDELAKALNNTTDVEGAEGAIDLIQKKLQEVKNHVS